MANDAVQIVQDCKQRVAFDLMTRIAQDAEGSKPKDREYYLTLFEQCLKAASGHSAESILRQK